MLKVFCNLESLFLPALPEQWECVCASQEWFHNLLLLTEKWHSSDYTDKTMNNIEIRRGEHSASTTLGECRALPIVLGRSLCCCPWWCSCCQSLMPLFPTHQETYSSDNSLLFILSNFPPFLLLHFKPLSLNALSPQLPLVFLSETRSHYVDEVNLRVTEIYLTLPLMWCD